MSEIKVNSVVNSTGDNDSGLDLSTNDQVIIKTANTTAVTVDSSQHVGIGTTSPDGTLHIHSASAGSVTANSEGDELIVENNGNGGISILTPDTARSALFFGHASDNNKIQIRHDGNTSLGAFISDDTLTFNVGSGTERMRFDSSGGHVFIGASSFSSGAKGKQFEFNNNAIALRSGSALTTTQFHEEFHNPNGAVGTISTNGSSTSFNTSSDYRLKENVSYNFDATTRLKQLKPARFNFIADAETTLDGFLAHEVADVVPEAITGEKDATEIYTDEDGNKQTRIKPQSIDLSKLVPLLVKTIQELEARVTALEKA